MAQMHPARLVEYLGSRDKRAGYDGRTYRFIKNKDLKSRRVLSIDDDRAFRFFTEGANGEQFVVAKDLERERESVDFLTLLSENAAAARKILGVAAKKPEKKAATK